MNKMINEIQKLQRREKDLFNKLNLLTKGNNWKQVPGGLKNVSASGNGYVWGVNKNNSIYTCKKPCDGNWRWINGSLEQVSGDENNIWGVNKNNNIYKRPVNGSGNWKQVPGGLKNVSASGKGYVWGVNKNNTIYKCKKPCDGNWIQTDGTLVQVSGDENNIWGLNNLIWKRPIDGTGYWTNVSSGITGGLKNISASGKDYVVGVNNNNNIYKCKKPCNGNWIKTNGGLEQVSGDENNIWGVMNNWIWKKPIKTINKNYKNVGDFDAYGNDLGRVPATTVDNCKLACDNNPDCVGFAYDNPTGDCYPKTNISIKQPSSRLNLFSKENSAEQQKIINEINNLSNIRSSLLKTLNDNYKNLMLNVSDRKDLTENQLKLIMISENELNDFKFNINNLIQDKNNKLRKVEINTYYSEKYNSYLRISTIVIIFCVPFLILGILSKKGILPSNIINVIMSILLVLLIIIILMNLFDINIRNNMNFNEYDTYKVSSTTNVKPVQSTSGNKTLNNNLNIGTCIGSNCCSKGTSYNETIHKCV
jgi:hypothetical protein